MDFLRRFLFAVALSSPALAVTLGTSPETLSSELQFTLTHSLEKVETPPHVLMHFINPRTYADLENDPVVMLDKVMNFGRTVWKIIQENKPVVTVNTIFANALPAGVISSADLEDFSNLRYESYKRSGKNGFGKNAYEVIYTVVHRYGGRYRGHGQYLDNVTVLPASVKASWGYNVELGVQEVATSALRMGDDPIARILLTLDLQISTISRSSKFRTLFEFTGDSKDHITVSDEFIQAE